MPEFSDPQLGAQTSEFLRLGTETVPLTNTRTVKFRQTVNKVPIYGSLVTVELDEDNRCLAINSSLGSPKDPLFTHQDLSALFYLALTQHLSRTSEFADSLRALLLVARTLFRADSPATLRRKTRAITRAFSAVGIG